MTDLERLQADVQRNCHVSDALFARDYSLCIYLLKMREYFRWEKGYRYTASLPDKDLGEWLSARERLWQELEEAPFSPLAIGEESFDPFAAESINAALAPHGLTYGGGYGNGAKPLFFLARREREIREGALHILIAGHEYARDLTAPPAMTRGNTVYVRRESLRRLLWERLEEWRWRKQEGPMARAAGHYPFDHDFEAALDAMTDAEIESAILHERGEHAVGLELGHGWEAMLAAVPRSRTEYILRAVRDHLADCALTLPTLLEQERHPSVHFYFANLTGLRRALFPALVKAYEVWHTSMDPAPLAETVRKGEHYWREAACALLKCYREEGNATALARVAEGLGL